MKLTDFLLDRIADDEAALRGTHEGRATGQIVHVINHFDHRRLESECEAKRRIAALHSEADGRCETCYIYATGVSDNVDYCPTIRALAAVYSDHPDYDPEWRP